MQRLFDSGYAVLAMLIGEEVVEPQPDNDCLPDTLAGHHRWFWTTWDCICRRILGIRPLSTEEPYLFDICKRRHWGRSLSINGTVVCRFDPVVEIHLNNALVSMIVEKQVSVVGTGTRLLREARRSLVALAECLRSPQYQDVSMIFGVSLVNRGLERLGFEVSSLPGRGASRFLQWYLGNLFKAINPEGRRLLQQRPEAFVPKRLAMSKDRLLDLYGTLEP